MKKLTLLFTSISILILASCYKKQQVPTQEELKFVQDSIRTDSIFRYKIAALQKSIDSLLPYSERKLNRDVVIGSYREMFNDAVSDRIQKLHLKSDGNTYDAWAVEEVRNTIRSEFEKQGYDRNYIEKEIIDWERTHSKNIVSQRFKEEELAKLQSDYAYFKLGNR